MPVWLHCNNFVLTKAEVVRLWEITLLESGSEDEEVGVRCVEETEITRLNREYRGHNCKTNVLTFSYGDGEHDVAVCLEVAGVEAKKQDVDIRKYAAWLLVHAFLHVVGMDHELSELEGEKVKRKEQKILTVADIA